MAKLTIQRCDGGKKGASCREIVEKAFQNFFSCGVDKISDACNKKRNVLVTEWQCKRPEAAMSEYGLSIPYRRGIEEITPPFSLIEPDTIELYVLEGKKSEVNQDAPMDITVNPDFTLSRLNVYLDLIDYANDKVHLLGAQESIEEIVYHELLHACGDVQYDGVLRHNLIGIASVNELLGK